MRQELGSGIEGELSATLAGLMQHTPEVRGELAVADAMPRHARESDRRAASALHYDALIGLTALRPRS